MSKQSKSKKQDEVKAADNVAILDPETPAEPQSVVVQDDGIATPDTAKTVALLRHEKAAKVAWLANTEAILTAFGENTMGDQVLTIIRDAVVRHRRGLRTRLGRIDKDIARAENADQRAAKRAVKAEAAAKRAAARAEAKADKVAKRVERAQAELDAARKRQAELEAFLADQGK